MIPLLWILAWCVCGILGVLLVIRGSHVAGGRLDREDWFLLSFAAVGCSPLLLCLGLVVSAFPRHFFTTWDAMMADDEEKA